MILNKIRKRQTKHKLRLISVGTELFFLGMGPEIVFDKYEVYPDGHRVKISGFAINWGASYFFHKSVHQNAANHSDKMPQIAVTKSSCMVQYSKGDCVWTIKRE